MSGQNEEQDHKPRQVLPSVTVDRSKASIYSILKQCVGELYRFTLPIIWNEPLSLTQRMVENARYADTLLDKASKQTNPVDRMKYVAAFLVSSTSVHINRLSKPFNPLLGETFEFTSKEHGYQMVCEQVSHHPPITAGYCESIRPSKHENKVRWKYYGSVNPYMKINFLHACVECFPEGIQTVELPEWDEVYTWHNLKVTAHNIVIGKLWIENTGRVEIINHKLKMKCVMDFEPYSWFSKAFNKVKGHIEDMNETKVALLSGKWDEFLYSTDSVDKSGEFMKLTEKLRKETTKLKKSTSTKSFKESDIECLWETKDTNKLHQEFYMFSDFAISLNEIHPELVKPCVITVKDKELQKNVSIGPIPPTDSRYRPDLRLFENGECDRAAEEKHRLEEKQREKRNNDSSFQENWKPMWFDKQTHRIVEDEETFNFNQKYWQRDFAQCPDIY